MRKAEKIIREGGTQEEPRTGHTFQRQSREVEIQARGLGTTKAHLGNNKYHYWGLKKTDHFEKYRREK